jgi:hypothetical protein
VRRIFTTGNGASRKTVVIDLSGRRMAVVRVKSDGSSARDEKELRSEAEAHSAGELLARELVSRGYVEQDAPGSSRGVPVAPRVSAPPPPRPQSQPAARAAAPAVAEDLYALEEPEEPAPAAAPVLPRVAPPPADEAGETKPKKKAGRKKKRKKKGGGEDTLDKRVIAGAGAAGALIFGIIGFLAYDALLKPASIIGTWQGSRLDYEAGGAMSYMQYRLVLDAQKRASMTLMGDMTSTGTYEVKGDRLLLRLRDADDEEGGGEDAPLEYKISLGRATLDLYDPASNKKVVELVRQREKPALGGPAGGPAAPKAPAPADVPAGDPAAEAQLASVQFAPQDNAFKVRHPAGWEAETGSRPDNTYSWARFTQGSAKIQIYADVVGSLMTQNPTGQQYEEGSEFAPVHRAHELYKKTISEEYSEYNEGEPTVFKGSLLGEGRIATFTATESGLFGSKVQGFRVTLLTNDRRITVLCQCSGKELEKLKPTFYAVCRSVSR